MEDRLEADWLSSLEWQNSIFPEIDYHYYL
jgi:hypothetical protein